METILFALSMAVCLINLLSLIVLMFVGRVYNWPQWKYLDPDSFVFVYPSWLYQCYFWAPSIMELANV